MKRCLGELPPSLLTLHTTNMHQNRGEECPISNLIASSPLPITHIQVMQKRVNMYACLSIYFEWHQIIILIKEFLSQSVTVLTTHTHTQTQPASTWELLVSHTQQDQAASQTPNKCLGYTSESRDRWWKQGAVDTRTHYFSPHNGQHSGDSNHAEYTCQNTNKHPQN